MARGQFLNGKFHGWDNDGDPAVAGKLWAWVSGSSRATLKSTYSDSGLTIANTNPVTLDGSGRATVVLEGGVYEFELKDSAGAVLWTIDGYSVGLAPWNVLSKASDYTVLTTDGPHTLILVDATSGSKTINLYTAVGNSGNTIQVVKIDNTVNTVTVDPLAAQTINGAATVVLRGQYDGVQVVSDNANWVSLPGVVASPQIPQGRLTLTSGTAYTTADVTAATSVYYAPLPGARVWLFTGSRWVEHRLAAELTLSLAAFAANTPFDVFLYDNAGTLTLQAVAWTNDTTRATALTTQDGFEVKSGALTHLYVGSVRTTATIGQTEDSKANRLLWNRYHQAEVPVQSPTETTDTWVNTAGTLGPANAPGTTNRIAVMVGLAGEMVDLVALHSAQNATAAAFCATAIGEDSTSVAATGCLMPRLTVNGGVVSATAFPMMATLKKAPAIGYHYYAWLEFSSAAGTTTWHGDSGAPTVSQSGLSGTWKR